MSKENQESILPNLPPLDRRDSPKQLGQRQRLVTASLEHSFLSIMQCETSPQVATPARMAMRLCE